MSGKKSERPKRTHNMIKFNELVELIRAIPDPNLAKKIVLELKRKFESGGIDPNDFDEVLFDPFLEDMRDLPPGILAERERVIPLSQVMDAAFCASSINKKLIHAGQNDQLISLVEETWVRFASAPTLRDHNATLHQLARSQDRNAKEFLWLVTSGNHGSAQKQLAEIGPINGLTMRECLSVILVETLIFTARDVQANMATLYLAVREPMFGLVGRVVGYIRLTGLATIFRKVPEALAYIFNEYPTRDERIAHRRERMAQRINGKRLPPAKKVKIKGSISRLLAMLVEKRMNKLAPREGVRLRHRLDRAVSTRTDSSGIPFVAAL